MSNSIEIHEFSTGIKPDRDSQGNWISRGFTGSYMNYTLPEIPYNVERAIVNQKFAIVEGFTTHQPAIIGRLVPGISNSPNELGKLDWSVVAIVNRGRDEKGRPLSVYRYFLTQGFKLQVIVAWLEQFQENNAGKLPVFNPYEEKSINDCIRVPQVQPSRVELPQNITNWLEVQDNTPILMVQRDNLSLSDVHYRASYKASLISASISWAYKVEALEEPGNFIIISAASEIARKRIENSRNSVSANSRLMLPPAYFDWQMLRAQIKNLTHKSNISREAVQEVFEIISNKGEVTEDIWQKIFDGEGASRAIRQRIYSTQMLRILTLRAIAIPQTLPEFLDWLSADKANINIEEFLEFSKSMMSSLYYQQKENLKNNLFEGIREVFIRNKVSDTSQEFFDNLITLLTNNNSLWNICLDRVIIRTYRDLELIANIDSQDHSESFSYEEALWKEIIRNWSNLRSGINFEDKEDRRKYLRFANLFSQVSLYVVNTKTRKQSVQITSYFCQISKGEVPKNLFCDAFNKKKWEANFLKVPIRRKLTFEEKSIKSLTILGQGIYLITIKPIEFLFKFLWYILTKVWSIFTGILLYINNFVRDIWLNSIGKVIQKIIESQIKINSIVIVFTLALILIALGYLWIEPIMASKKLQLSIRKDNFNNSINILNDLSESFQGINLNKEEKLSFIINEVLPNKSQDNCLISEKYLFLESDKIDDDCKKQSARNFINYEKSIKKKIKKAKINPDGIIDNNTAEYIKSQISGILDPKRKRFKEFAFPILAKLVSRVEETIGNISPNNYSQLNDNDANRIVAIVTKDYLTPKEYQGRELQFSILKEVNDISNEEEDYNEFINEKKPKLSTTNSEYLQAWAERFFVYCIKKEECQISSILDQTELINKFENKIIPDFTKKVKNKAKEIASQENKKLTILEEIQKLKSNTKEISATIKAFNSFKNTRKVINIIEQEVYSQLINESQTKDIALNQNQQELIKNKISDETMQIFVAPYGSELVNLGKTNPDKVKQINLEKLDRKIELETLEEITSQLRWIQAISNYQRKNNETIIDGIMSNSNYGTGKKLKEDLLKNIDNVQNIINENN